MSAYRLPWVLSQVAVMLRSGPSSVSRPAALVLHQHHARQYQLPHSCSLGNNTSSIFHSTTAAFSTEATGDGDNKEPLESKPKRTKVKQDPHAPIGSVGRKIPHRHILLLSETGENMGVFHRAVVIKMMTEKQLRLVVVNEDSDPPVYRLMTGKQIHEEQMKLREKIKNKPAPVQVKELTFSSDIGSRDLSTKLRQISSWLDKKYHVKVTLRAASVADAQALDKSLEAALSKDGLLFGYISAPRLIKEGRSASCVIRAPAKKEKHAAGASSASAGTSDTSRDTLPPTSPPPPTSPAKKGSVEKETDSE